MEIPFTKMHGSGNDFVVFDAFTRPIKLSARQIRRVADRHTGVGCDQVLLVERPRRSGVDFRYRIFNADGGEVEQCGNGARCFAVFVRAKGLTRKKRIAVETKSGVIYPSVNARGEVSVDMGIPRFEPREVPFEARARASVYDLDVDGELVKVSVLSMGNPHAVLIIPDVDAAPVARMGPLIERHGRFPKRANAGFMQIVDRRRIRLRVYERGAGETLACGSGACAAVVAGRTRGMLDAEVRVEVAGGVLTVAWAGEGERVILTGPAKTVYEGKIDLAKL